MANKTTKTKVTQKRHLSPVLWAALVGLVGFVLGNWGLYQYIGLNSETFQTFAGLLSTVLVTIGIINDPTNKSGF